VAQSRGKDLNEDSGTTLIKSLCELDQGEAAINVAKSLLSQHETSGQLHYYCGMAKYLAGATTEDILASFVRSDQLGFSGGKLGLGFLKFADRDFEAAIELMQSSIIEDPELLHIRELMLFQINITIGDIEDATAHLKESNRILVNWPSLIRSYWGHVCSARLLRQQGNFSGSQSLLEHLLDQLHLSRTPRLVRNIKVTKSLANNQDSNTNINVPKNKIQIDQNRMKTITTKPILNSLYHFLKDKKSEGACKDQIVKKVWDESYNPLRHDDRIYKTIGRLRKLLGDDLQSPQLLTLNGKNYVLSSESTPLEGVRN